jgi:hypothetical protein
MVGNRSAMIGLRMQSDHNDWHVSVVDRVESSRIESSQIESSRVTDCMHASVHPHLIGVEGVLLAEVNANDCGSR